MLVWSGLTIRTGGEDGHLVVDLKNLRSITVNGEVRRIDGATHHHLTLNHLQQATIGGGAYLGDVGVALSAQGRALANGVCPFV